jgi:hypothetical protein
MKDFKNSLKKNGWSGGDETGIKWKSGSSTIRIHLGSFREGLRAELLKI